MKANHLNDTTLLNWLRLIRTPKIGPIQFHALLERHGSVQAALKWLSSPHGSAKAGIGRLCGTKEAERELDQLRQLGGEMVTQECHSYPTLLREIADPPPVLSYFGRIEFAHAPIVAIVGSRNASANGRKLATRLASDVSAKHITIASGLARGIDTAAHQGGLLGSGSTIAVIASGVDIAYPSENRELMNEIAQNGLVMSERPLGAAPMARHFPRRNRIISGLSRAVVVVEAAEKSGSLMTARLALEQGREVMAVPGSPLDARHKGTNRLLRDGAAMVEEGNDILFNLPAFERPLKLPIMPKTTIKPERPTPSKTVAPIVIKPKEDLAERLVSFLGPEPTGVDELIRQCHASAAEVQDVLLQLEMDGRLVRLPGNCVALEVS